MGWTYRAREDTYYVDTTAEITADTERCKEVGAHAVAFDNADKSYTANGTNWLDDDTFEVQA